MFGSCVALNNEMLDIAVNLRKKYNKISELLDITQQMSECIGRNDMVSFEILINMRTDILLEIEGINDTREQIIEALEPQKAERIEYLMQEDIEITNDISNEELKVHSTFKDCKSVTAKLIAIDKVINKKICGDESFYSK